jgi:hypothetical protein
MTRRTWIAAAVAPLVAVTLILASVAIAQQAQATTTRSMLVTLYGWPDNSPPGDGTAFGTGHAGGVGTWNDPITFATDQHEYAPGTKVYYPYLNRYFIMQDECVECDADWRAGKYHIDLWVGGQGANANAVISCENSLTQENGQVIIDPPSNEPVDTTPLFNSATNQCYKPGSNPGNPGNPGGANQLQSGQRLSGGQGLTSSNGRFHLNMQTDGNLVIYDGSSPIWATGTWNLPSDRRPTHANMQSDGNLVLYNDANQASWASGSWGSGRVNPFVEMQDDGNVVIYHNGRSPIWASGTAR